MGMIPWTLIKEETSPVKTLNISRSTRLWFLEGISMDLHNEEFTVYVRTDPSHAMSTEDIEIPLASFSSYEDALRAQRAYQLPARECVIRYQGDTGGGD
jgi:hypothetical protein